MCFATGAAIASAVAGVAGAGVSALGAITQGQAAGRNAAYQSQVAANNATIAQQNAQYATEAGSVQAQEASMKSAAQVGAVKAAIGANDVDVDTGSPLTTQVSQRETGVTNTEQTMQNALLQAYGYNTQATSFEAESGLEQAEAVEAPEEGELSAAGGLLSNASSIGFKFANPSGGSSTTDQGF